MTAQELSSSDYAVVLVNLGTPAAPEVPAIKAYLNQFLSDKRVVDYPDWLWQPILQLAILPFRSRKVAKAYQSIWWPEGSPLRVITERQVNALQQRLPMPVRYAMTYGEPAIGNTLKALTEQGVKRIVILPLYPQYSATTTAAVSDQVGDFLRSCRNQPEIRFHKHYHQHPLYRQALAASVRQHWQQHGQADALLLSFHGIPKRFVELGDPYEAHCFETAAQLAEDLGWPQDKVIVSFQSRVGKEQWLQPYTDQLLQTLPAKGIKNLQVLSPAFAADCLETLEELSVENKEIYLHAGGESYQYIAALNDSSPHIDVFAAIVQQQVQGW